MDERTDPGAELRVQPVRERAVEGEDRPINADRDRSRELFCGRGYSKARRSSSAREVSSQENPLRPKCP